MQSSKYVASCSFGKDSLAMILMLIERGMPLDEVIFYDTGMEFQAIYNNRDKLIPILEKNGIKFTKLHPKEPFLFCMFERQIKYRKQEGYHYGYGWCGGTCRWGTNEKCKTIDAMVKEAVVHYIGIAADEPERIERLIPPKKAPLAEWGITEKEALQYCFDHGWNWLEMTDRQTDRQNYIPYWIGFLAGVAETRIGKNYITFGSIFPNIGES